MPYTNVAKPTGAAYTNVAKPTGTSYTNLAKPGGVTSVAAGMAIGLLIPLTISISQILINPYTNITKPT